MPRFFDDQRIRNGLRNEVIPTLERLAANPNLRDRSLRRFDRDEPPPYTSSTESDEEQLFASHPALGLGRLDVLQKYKTLMHAPLNDEEQASLACVLQNSRRAYHAGERFCQEVRLEHEHLFLFYHSQRISLVAKEFLRGRPGKQREPVIIRRNIRRRWQKLGIWNPQWGIPGRVNGQPNDDTSKWKWSWQHGSGAAEWFTGVDEAALNSQHPTTRAVQLRQGLYRGEHNPVPPRSHLEEDTSAAQAESFIISRPWFAYLVEEAEEGKRLFRLPIKDQFSRRDPTNKPVLEWWRQRGDWKEDWEISGRDKPVPGWKWRHESPSPEPEDLTPLNNTDMEFSPSEVDALEAIPPAPPMWKPPSTPGYYGPTRNGEGPFGNFIPLVPSTPPDEPDERAPERSRDLCRPLPDRRRLQRDEVDPTQVPAQPRRSDRIAAMKSTPPPTSSAPDRRTRARAPKGKAAEVQTPPRVRGRSTTRPVPARPPRTETPIERGRPRKANGRFKPSAVSKARATSRKK